MREKKMMKPWHGLILLALSAVCIFFVSPWMSSSLNLGLYGTLLNELLLLLLAVGTVLVFGGDLKTVFPFKKIKLSSVFGVVIFWMGCFGAIMIVSLFMSALFPKQMLETGGGLGGIFTSVAFLVSFFIVSISPAICEEAVFRGVVLNSFRGSWGKWAAIILSGVIFGCMHGSIWRFIPTATLGIAMGYIVCETGNIFYSMLFHAINNACPIILLFLLEILYGSAGMDNMLAGGVASELEMPVSMVGIYLIFGGAAAFFIYIGNHLLRLGQPGYQNGLFPREKRKVLYILLGITFGCFIIGILSGVYFMISQQDSLQEIMDSVYSLL